ncbi:hypothetical protein ACJX0J_021769, partial [Zea mays]
MGLSTLATILYVLNFRKCFSDALCLFLYMRGLSEKQNFCAVIADAFFFHPLEFNKSNHITACNPRKLGHAHLDFYGYDFVVGLGTNKKVVAFVFSWLQRQNILHIPFFKYF